MEEIKVDFDNTIDAEIVVSPEKITYRKFSSDFTGQKFDKLTVIKRVSGSITPKGRYKSDTVWLCKCECGNYRETKRNNLIRKGVSISCGQGRCNPNFNDLSGKQFGNLTVIKCTSIKSRKNNINASLWLCNCTCGNKREIIGSNLTSGEYTTCKEGICYGKLDNLIGKIFGRWTVVKLAKYSKVTKWDCKCLCGKNRKVRATDLVSGDSKSCGCLSNYMNPQDASRAKVLHSYRRNSKYVKTPFELTDEEAFILFKGNCHYCGREPFRKMNIHLNKDGSLKTKSKYMTYETALKYDYKFNGIDKKDPLGGYITSNCVSCCWPCNNDKSATPYDEYIERIDKKAEYRISLKNLKENI